MIKYLILFCTLMVLPALASDTIYAPQPPTGLAFVQTAGGKAPINIGYTTDGNGHLKLLNSEDAVDDDLLIPDPPTGKAFLAAADGKQYPIMVLYTTDGDGNIMPVPSGGGGGGGTVTSVALTAPSFLSVAGSPVTTSGTLAVTLATQAVNKVFAGPASGGSAAPTFRSLVAADIPSLPYALTDLSNLDATTAISSTLFKFASGNPVISGPDFGWGVGDLTVKASGTVSGSGSDLNLLGGAGPIHGGVNITGGAGANTGGDVAITGGVRVNVHGGDVILKGGTGPSNGTVKIQRSSEGTAGSLLFESISDGSVQWSGSDLVWDNTNKSLLVGTTSQPSGATGVPLSLVSTNATSANGFEYIEYVQSNTSGNGIAIRKARGTTGTRTNVITGDNLGSLTFNGYTSAGYGAGTVAIAATAEEDFNVATNGNRGSSLTISTTPIGALAPNGGRRATAKFFSTTSSQTQSLKLFDIAGTNGITMSVPSGSNYAQTLPPSLPAGNAFYTIGSGGTANYTQLSGDATTGAAQGSLVVTGIQGINIFNTPTAGQFLVRDVAVPQLNWVSASGDVSTSGNAVFSVNKIKGTAVSATPPNDGEVLKYNSGTTQYEPAVVGLSSKWASSDSFSTNWGGTYPTIYGDSTQAANYNIGATDVPTSNTTDSGAYMQFGGGAVLEPTSAQPSGGLELFAGRVLGTGDAGEIGIWGASAGTNGGSGNGSSIFIYAGNVNAAGSGDAGSIEIVAGGNSGSGAGGGVTIGIGGGSPDGTIKLQPRPSGAQAAIGQVFTATATDGSGTWSSGYTKVTKSFSDFSAAANSNSITLFSLPAATMIKDIIIRPTASFTGGTLSTYTISVGVSGSDAKYASAFDVLSGITGTRFQVSNSTDLENFSASTNITATATSTGDTLDNASAGSVDIYYSLKSLN